MLHFGKRFKFGKIAVEDEEDEIEDSGEQARFSPQIIAEDNSGKLPSMDFEDEEEPAKYEAPDARTNDFSNNETDLCAPNNEKQVLSDKKDAAVPAEEAGSSLALEDDKPLDAPIDAKEEYADAPQIESLPDNARIEEIFPETPEKSEESVAGSDENDGAQTERENEGNNEPSDEAKAIVADDAIFDDARPTALFPELRSAPLCEQVYGLYGGRMMLSCFDEESGGVFLFEDSGDWILVQPEDCAAFLRIREAEGVFRGKVYKTDDLTYLLKEKTFPIGVSVRSREEYELAIKDGYLPFKQTAHTIEMIKPMSLYRMKDLALRVEFADGRNCSDSDEYLVNFERDLIEENEGSKQFRRICKAAAEKLLHTAQPSFALQVLKVRKNLVLAFPMDGKPRVGDRFAGGIITDLAVNPDGTIVMRIGSDEEVSLNVAEGKTARGQRLIILN